MSKKLTLASALTVGIIASSMSFALASSPCGCELPKIENECSKCHKTISDCECSKKKEEKCSKCHKKLSSCECGIPKAQQCDVPACASCASNECGDKNFKQQQVYAYPNAIYGGNQVVGEDKAGVTIGNAYNSYQKDKCAANCGANVIEGEFTGAAVQVQGCDCEVIDMNKLKLNENKNSSDLINIQTQSSREVIKKSLVPMEIDHITGAALPMAFNMPYSDVSDQFWASCDINTLTQQCIVVGYPDNTFKPNRPITRAEFATMAVKGLNIDEADCIANNFTDVPSNHWANKFISDAVSADLMKGYPNNKFKPNQHITRTEALTILSKGIKCDMDASKVNEVLREYIDAGKIPAWARECVAKALNAGALNDSPNSNKIMPNKNASRAEIVAMLENIRVSMGLSKDCSAKCDELKAPTKAYMEKSEIVKIPTLKLSFLDEVSAKSADVGNQFAAKTLDDVMIDGVNYPAGSLVRGKVQEVIRPTKDCDGGLKLSFETIQCGDMKTNLPKQILAAQVNCMKKPNGFVRTIQWPFTWVGGLLGNVGRTIGGAVISASNAVENVTQGFGVGSSELLTGQFKAAGRSYQDIGKNIVKAPVDVTRTALSGTMGLFQYTGDEVAYLVDPNGMKVSSINPKEDITISFGCD